MIELPARRRDRRRDREVRGVLLVRHQRPDPDDVGLLARRRRVVVLQPLPRARHLPGRARSSRSTSTASAGWCGTPPRLGRQAHPDLHLGVCGEHGGDPASIHFFDEVGLDYVSCSPFRVPVARLEAGRSALDAVSPPVLGGTARPRPRPGWRSGRRHLRRPGRLADRAVVSPPGRRPRPLDALRRHRVQHVRHPGAGQPVHRRPVVRPVRWPAPAAAADARASPVS